LQLKDHFMLDSDDAANSIDDHKKFDVLVEAL
jgi:hypothetical protein